LGQTKPEVWRVTSNRSLSGDGNCSYGGVSLDIVGDLVAVGVDDRFVDDAFFVRTISRAQPQRKFGLALTPLSLHSFKKISINSFSVIGTGLGISLRGCLLLGKR